MTGQPGQVSGVVEVRLSGEPEDVEVVLALLASAAADGQRAEIIRRTGPRTNRYDPGIRRYLTVRVTWGDRP